MSTVQPYSATAQVKSLVGTAALPGITFTGDTDTGLYSPAANQVAITTGGVQRLLIGSDGSITPSGSFLFPVGTTVSPSLSFTGDTNTGIYSPGADQLAITTNGVERVEWGASEVVFNDSGENYDFRIEGDTKTNLVFVDASTDRVGINTSTPSDLVHIHDTSGTTLLRLSNNSAGSSSSNTIFFESQSFNKTATITHSANSSSNSLQIGGVTNFTYDSDSHLFRSASGTNRLHIDSSGSLYLAGTSGNSLSIDGAASANRFTANGSNIGIGIQPTNGVPIYIVSSSGPSIAMGSNNPNYFGFVYGIQYSADEHFFYSSALGAYYYQMLITGPNGVAENVFNNSNADIDFRIAGDNSSNVFFVDASTDRIGIGTTSPGAILHSVVSSAGVAFRGSNNNTSLDLYANDATGEARITAARLGGSGGKFLSFYTDTGSGEFERARIDSSGRLLIGVSASRPIGGSVDSQQLIESNGVASVAIVQNSNNTTSASLRFGKSRATAVGGTAIVASGDNLGFISFSGADGNNLQSTAASIAAQVDGTPGANDMPGRLVFSTTASGASAPTERLRIDSTGQIEAGSLGTAAAPVWSFLSDTNTGIYSPGADQLAISTNGTGRLFVDASGKILVNQSSQLSNATGQVLETNGNIVVNSVTTGAGQTASLDFYHLVSTATATRAGSKIESFAESSYTAGLATSSDSGLRFYTVDNAIQSERLRITADGKVGVGTTSPTAPLCVQGVANSDQLIVTGSNGLSRGLKISTGADFANDSLVKYDSQYASGSDYGAHAFLTGGQERLRLDRFGRLLVGAPSARSNFSGNTATPLVQIEGVTAATASSSVVRGAADALGPTFNLGKTRGTSVGQHTVVVSGDQCGVITFQGADGTNLIRAAQIEAAVDGTPGANDMPGRLVFSTTADGAASPTERMRITAAGNVGVGTTSPTALLHIANSSLPVIRLDNTSANYWEISNDSNLIFNRGGTERLRIDASGRLLVGTSNSFSVRVGATTFITPQQQLGGTNDAAASFVQGCASTSDSAGAYHWFAKFAASTIGDNTTVVANDEILGGIGWSGSDGAIQAQAALIAVHVDGTPGAGDIPGRLVFSTTADGASSPTERLRIGSAGQIGLGGANFGTSGQILTSNGPSAAPTWQTITSGSSSDKIEQGDTFAQVLDSGVDGRFIIKTEGAERLRITSTGLVGLGTSTPSELLTIGGATTNIGVFNTTPGTTGSPSFSKINFYGFAQNANGNIASISAGNSQTNNFGGTLQFATNTTGGTHTTAVTIDSSQRVGVGTTSPSALVHLSSATGTASPTPTELRIGTSSAASDWSTTSPWGRISFYNEDTSGGGPKVHIAIDSVSSTSVGSVSDLSFKIVDSATTTLVERLKLNFEGTLTTTALANRAPAIWNIGASEVARIDSSGRLGIGTPGPLGILHIKAGTAGGTDPTVAANSIFEGEGAVSLMLNGTDSSTQSIYFRDASTAGNSFRGAVRYTHSDDALALFSAGTERARIDSSGRLLVGYTLANTTRIATTSVTPPIQILGTTFGANSCLLSSYNVSATGSSYLLFARSKSGAVGTDTAVSSDDRLGALSFAGYDGSLQTEAARIFVEVDGTPGVNDMPGRLVFATTADGASSPTERMRIDSSGRVGVGTASPSTYNTNLAVYSAGGAFVGALHANTSGTFPKASAISLGSDAVSYTYTTGGASVALTGSAHIAALQNASSGAGTDIAFMNTSGGSVSEKARIDSSGRLLVGTSDGSGGVSKLVVQGASNGSAVGVAQISYNGLASAALAANTDIGYLRFTDQGSNSGVFAQITATADAITGAGDYPGRLVFGTTADGASSPTERMRIRNNGTFEVKGAGSAGTTPAFSISGTAPANSLVVNSSGTTSLTCASGQPLLVGSITGIGEVLRVESSGRLLLGDNDSIPTKYDGNSFIPNLYVVGTNNLGGAAIFRHSVDAIGAGLILNKSRGADYTPVIQNDTVGYIGFAGATDFGYFNAASIKVDIDGAPANNDMPGRLVFSTTADGAGSPTERMRIASTGAIGVNGANYGSSGQALISQGSTSPPVWGSVRVDVQEFTSSGTWTKPTDAKLVYVEVIGGGGGGGSGMKQAAPATSDTFGAGGGAGGMALQQWLVASSLGATVAVTVGAGGTGGAGVTTATTNGNNGVSGGNSSFGSLIVALGGGQGGRGSLVNGTGGSTRALAVNTVANVYMGNAGGGSSNSGASNDGSEGFYSPEGPGGGGAGGGTRGSDGFQRGGGAGGGGFVSYDNSRWGQATGGGGTPGAGGGNNGGAGANAGDGGGGGGSGNTLSGGNGGAGAFPGGGGGGGGSTNTGATSGAGGAGGNGVVRVYTYF